MSLTNVSFEFFPPRNLDASFKLWESVQTLSAFEPEFVSLTYGAGGTTQEITRDAVTAIQKNYGLKAAAHLTCVGTSRAQTLNIAQDYAAQGVSEIVALRGDPPAGQGSFTPHPEGFADSAALVRALAEKGQFKIRVGAYPEQHPDAADADADVRWLKHKFEAGAHSAITQFFLDPETFLRFRDRCAKAGIDAKIIPGILPITHWEGAKRFAKSCAAHIPQRLDDAFTKADQRGCARLYALAHCTQLCDRLIEEGVEDLHFYTLNRADLTQDVLTALGMRPKAVLKNVA